MIIHLWYQFDNKCTCYTLNDYLSFVLLWEQICIKNSFYFQKDQTILFRVTIDSSVTRFCKFMFNGNTDVLIFCGNMFYYIYFKYKIKAFIYLCHAQWASLSLNKKVFSTYIELCNWIVLNKKKNEIIILVLNLKRKDGIFQIICKRWLFKGSRREFE